jgi:hypothetical protein
MSLVEQSDALHARVQAFARAAFVPATPEGFDELALALAHFQARYSQRFARLVEHHASRLDAVDSIPAVPAEAFRLTRVALHSEALDQARFVTSGTTDIQRGVHAMRRLDTYRCLSVAFGKRALASALGPEPLVVALAERPSTPPSSSLTMMMQFFMEDFESRAPRTLEGRWLMSSAGVDFAGLERAIRYASEHARPLLVLATAFALVSVLDHIGHAGLRAPERTLVMVTGGFKGKTRSIDSTLFRGKVAELFGIDARAVVGEYGMTELTSQLYEGTAPGAELEAPMGIYLAPSWLRVSAVHPETLEPLPDGEIGLARFVDLGNVDSAVAVLTDDLVRRVGPGIQLLGRRTGSVPRGCSLAIEELLRPLASRGDL